MAETNNSEYNLSKTETTLSQDEKQAISNNLNFWNEAYNNLEIAENNNNRQEENDWDTKTDNLHSKLMFLTRSEGINALYEISQDQEFKEKGKLARFLAYEIWVTEQPLEWDSEGIHNEENLKNLTEIKKQLYPPLQEITINLLHENKQADIKNIILLLYSSHQNDFTQNIIVDSRLNTEEKTKFIVEFMNHFGVISGVDLLASNLNNNPDIKKVYENVQGKEINKVFKEVKEIYSEIDFDKYFINTPEFTKKEVTLIKENINNYCQENNKNPKSIQILDIGAGTGRHAIPLFQEGYQITALEIQDEHTETIKRKEPNLPIIKQNWLEMNIENPIDFAYCLERSALHNQTPKDMLKFFDNISASLNDNGTLLIDFADTSTGEYQSKVKEYQQNLIKIGVKESSVQYIFDGVDSDHEINRMAPTQEQVEIYAKLTGLKLKKSTIDTINNIQNTYYTFTKDPDFDPSNLDNSEIQKSLFKLGLHNAGIDYNQFIKNWGMSIGQVYIYGIDDEKIRMANMDGEINPVSFRIVNNQTILEAKRPY